MNTKYYYITAILALGILAFSCKSDLPEETDAELDTISTIDSTTTVEVDTSSTIEIVDTLEKVYDNPEVQEAHVAIVKKYGVQWDFCTCIVKSDSVNTALMEADDDEFDLVMERSDFIDQKCKGLLIQPNSTPEDRYAHEKKVKKCLENAKK